MQWSKTQTVLKCVLDHFAPNGTPLGMKQDFNKYHYWVLAYSYLFHFIP